MVEEREPSDIESIWILPGELARAGARQRLDRVAWYDTRPIRHFVWGAAAARVVYGTDLR